MCGAASLPAQERTDSTRVTVTALLDGYFAYDGGRPTSDRAHTTQAARHAKADVNLAMVGVDVAGRRARGRVVLQRGTSVRVNYAAEPPVLVGRLDVARLLQEAFAGYRVARSAWIDAGIMLAPFGAESWISADNWTYTRSLVSEYSPYYEAGVRASWSASPTLFAQLHVINGWQNISETNADKAAAARVDYTPAGRISLAYDTFVGNERPRGAPRAIRWFQEVIARARISDRIATVVVIDGGRQHAANEDAMATWRGWAALLRYEVTDALRFAARLESYSDPRAIVAATNGTSGLRASGASITVDAALQPGFLWRFELRTLRSRIPTFPDRGATDGLSRHDLVALCAASLRYH